MISTTDLSIAVAIASATAADPPQTPPDDSLSPRHNMPHYYQMHHNHSHHHTHPSQSPGTAHHHHLHHLQSTPGHSHHHHTHLQHLLQHFGDSQAYVHGSRPGSATTPTNGMDDPSGPNADTCSSVSSTTIFGARICNRNCRCTNKLLTGIVITILPIAITSTLLFVFMMQKTNLHQYAIYSFVIFCVAFVFPFALFFFTVILNKIYKFYKRGIRTPADGGEIPDLDAACEETFPDQHSHQNPQAHHSTVDHHNHVHLYHDPSNLNGNSNLVYYQPYYFTTMTYHSGDIPPPPVVGMARDDHNCTNNNDNNTIHNSHSNNHANQQQHHHHDPAHYTEQTIPEPNPHHMATNPDSSPQESLPNSASSQSLEDSPPCYEMALLCPSVNSDHQIKNKASPPDSGRLQHDSYSPAKDSLMKVESIDYKDDMSSESMHRLHHHSTPSTSRNPSQEDEVDASTTQPDVDNDKCAEE